MIAQFRSNCLALKPADLFSPEIAVSCAQGLAAAVVPYSLRAVRLIVIYNTAYRIKYARYVKWVYLLRIWTVLATAILLVALLIFINMRDRYAM